MSLNFAGRPEEAIDSLKKAMRLSPFPPAYYIMNLGFAYKEAGHYEEAISALKKCIKLRPNNIFAHTALSTTYALAGRYEEAHEAWSEALKIDPKLSVEKSFNKCPYLPESCERSKAAKYRAGIK